MSLQFDDGTPPLVGGEGYPVGRYVPPRVLALLKAAFPPVYGGADLGYRLDGHECVTEVDKRIEADTGASLLYGEVAPEGVARLSDGEHCAVLNAQTVFDYGMGTGKLCLQLFFTYPHLSRVVGVEFSPSRFALAAAALRRVARCRRGLVLLADSPTECTVMDTRGPRKADRGPHYPASAPATAAAAAPPGGVRRRVLVLRCADIFTSLDARTPLSGGDAEFNKAADIVFLNTDFPSGKSAELGALFHSLRLGCRVATYANVRPQYLAAQAAAARPGAAAAAAAAAASAGASAVAVAEAAVRTVAKRPFTLVPVEAALRPLDRFATSWSPQIGHPFHVWVKGSIEAGNAPLLGLQPNAPPRFWVPAPGTAASVVHPHVTGTAGGGAKKGSSHAPHA